MNLFAKIPENFFSILSSKNKNIYGVALVALYDCLTIYRNKIRKSDYIDLLKGRIDKDLETFDVSVEGDVDDDVIFQPTLQSKINLVFRRLVDTGWIVVDVDFKTGAEYVLVPSYSVALLKILYEFVDSSSTRYVSNVHSTYIELKNADEEQPEYMYKALNDAVTRTKDLSLQMTTLDHSIRVFQNQLSTIFTPNDVLKQHFDIAREDVLDPLYHPLKTTDSIILYSEPINIILKRWMITSSVLEKIAEQAKVEQPEATLEELQSQIIDKINYIRDTYSRLSLEMNEIDKTRAAYTKASAEKVIYLNNNDKSIKGKLETIFLAIAKTEAGERHEKGQSYPTIIRDITHSITLFRQCYFDADSLQKPIHRSERTETAPLTIEEESESTDFSSIIGEEDLMFTDDKVLDFMDDAFGDNDKVTVSEIDIKNINDFIYLILGTVKSNDYNSFYSIDYQKTIDQFVNEKFSMPNYTFERRENKNVRRDIQQII